ncbi:MAG: hypothetical protein KDK45_16435, partial [Leptospiraceae bacterium]|nr:hypothetical protein [Leptospiraceae bacterium]
MENIELSYILNGKLEKTGFQVGEEGEFRSKDGFFILKSRSLVNRFQGQHISLSLHFSGQNPGASSLELETLKVDIKAPRLQSALVFQQGYQSWSFSVAYQHTERDLSPALEFLRYNEENVYTHHSGKFGDFQTEGFMALYSEKDKKGLLVGASSADGPNQTYRVLYKPNGEIHSLSVSFGLYCNREVNVNAKLDLGSLDTYEFKISPEEALENFARFSSEKYARPTREMPTPRGWCSWYYYYTEINEDVILNNLRLLQEKQPGLEFFQIDDGYQKEIGDWLLFN